MRASIEALAPLPLPSASGVEIVDGTAFVIADDAPFLYSFAAASLLPDTTVQLFESAHFSTGRIPKDRKPDLESLALVTDPVTGRRALLTFGSGATPAREAGYWIELTDAGRPGAVYPLALGPLYAALRPHLPAGFVLNLEAATVAADELWLFQRTIGAAAGTRVLRLPLGPALDLLRGRTATLPAVTDYAVALPNVAGYPAGFSGATTLPDGRVLVTASVEATTDAVLDGEVLASFVGILAGSQAHLTQLRWPDGRPLREKVEGVAVRRQHPDGRYELLLVTDDDRGGSSAIVVLLSL